MATTTKVWVRVSGRGDDEALGVRVPAGAALTVGDLKDRVVELVAFDEFPVVAEHLAREHVRMTCCDRVLCDDDVVSSTVDVAADTVLLSPTPEACAPEPGLGLTGGGGSLNDIWDSLPGGTFGASSPASPASPEPEQPARRGGSPPPRPAPLSSADLSQMQDPNDPPANASISTSALTPTPPGGSLNLSVDAAPKSALLAAIGAGEAVPCLPLVESARVAELNAAGPDGATPLLAAARRGLAPVCLALLERGADVAAADAEGNTALLLAAQAGLERVCVELIEQGADVHARNAKGDTPLLWAAQLGLVHTGTTLIRRGADVWAPNHAGVCPLGSAAGRGCEPLCKAILNAPGAKDVDAAQGASGETALLQSLRAGSAKVAVLLIETGGADVTKAAAGGDTPLIAAAQRGLQDACEVILARIPKDDVAGYVNRKNDAGTTALYAASGAAEREVCKLLIQHGADVTLGKAASLSNELLTLAVRDKFSVADTTAEAATESGVERKSETPPHSAGDGRVSPSLGEILDAADAPATKPAPKTQPKRRLSVEKSEKARKPPAPRVARTSDPGWVSETTDQLTPVAHPAVHHFVKAQEDVRNSAWQTQCRGLTMMRRYALFHPHFFKAREHGLPTVLSLLLACLKNLRSTVMKAALLTFSDMVKSDCKDMKALDGQLDNLVAEVLRLGTGDNKFIREAAMECFEDIVTHLNDNHRLRVMAKLLSHSLSSKSGHVRETCVSVITHAVSTAAPAHVWGHAKLPHLLKALSGYVSDAAEGCRHEGRRLVETLAGLAGSADEFQKIMLQEGADIASIEEVARAVGWAGPGPATVSPQKSSTHGSPALNTAPSPTATSPAARVPPTSPLEGRKSPARAHSGLHAPPRSRASGGRVASASAPRPVPASPPLAPMRLPETHKAPSVSGESVGSATPRACAGFRPRWGNPSMCDVCKCKKSAHVGTGRKRSGSLTSSSSLPRKATGSVGCPSPRERVKDWDAQSVGSQHSRLSVGSRGLRASVSRPPMPEKSFVRSATYQSPTRSAVARSASQRSSSPIRRAIGKPPLTGRSPTKAPAQKRPPVPPANGVDDASSLGDPDVAELVASYDSAHSGMPPARMQASPPPLPPLSAQAEETPPEVMNELRERVREEVRAEHAKEIAEKDRMIFALLKETMQLKEELEKVKKDAERTDMQHVTILTTPDFGDGFPTQAEQV
eukprot:TRINITY_DN8171_c0_g1_i2.p1 TRINITY_DN8171_c0_g1~~TRINITY_DN8171_c0_g1_i2.p1  ORF type:complete len:1202 (+),score=270.55 TRINITY_DN8171_c0_g1_i2:102-3707(+)